MSARTVLLAGATGAVGAPMTRALVGAGYSVLALARSEGSAQAARAAGAVPVRADALDRDGLLKAVDGLAADAVIHQLTAMKAPSRRLTEDNPTNVLRSLGSANLLEAAGVLGARRFLTQSLVLGYGYHDHGERSVTEEDPFGVRRGSVSDHVITGLVEAEDRLFAADHVDGTALRYGLFYGPGTWFDPTPGSRPMPVPLNGGGVMSWIHVDDAVSGTLAALEHGRAGEAYNLVDDRPARFGELAAAARRGRPGLRLPGWALRAAVPYLGDLMLDTTLRVSNAKAARDLGWTPRYPDHRAGTAAPAGRTRSAACDESGPVSSGR
ncbi:NAD-dependent epimerase/dehydratase family protein [Streptomyces sp. NRRL WC-3742]|uniref:NAD-dependent epimerase/dehydratase family protein n=1 Tax=Streptomyces sp. NRRL WC-3742 TaxID=1463934 RepID=UPI0007C5CEC5|nr:NAD(P)-dependent oxidoreductase [Streptomyces sp. NRRL WC-3742]